MARLIDAGELKHRLGIDNVFCNEFDMATMGRVEKCIDEMPTAIDMQQIAKELEQNSTEICGVGFITVNQVKRILEVWKYGATE